MIAQKFTPSPLGSKKNPTEFHYSCPSELLRLRLLAQMKRDKSSSPEPAPPVKTPTNEILKGVYAMADVRFENENRSYAYQRLLKAHGAIVHKGVYKTTTHVIFRQGMPSTLSRARLFNCHVVSVHWVRDCLRTRMRLNEANYAPLGLQMYESPDYVRKMRKRKDIYKELETDSVKKRKRRSIIDKESVTRKKLCVSDGSDDDENDVVLTRMNVVCNETVVNDVDVIPSSPWVDVSTNTKLEQIEAALRNGIGESLREKLNAVLCNDEPDDNKMEMTRDIDFQESVVQTNGLAASIANQSTPRLKQKRNEHVDMESSSESEPELIIPSVTLNVNESSKSQLTYELKRPRSLVMNVHQPRKYVVFTFFTEKQLEKMTHMVTNLGTAFVCTDVSSKTTHVVVASPDGHTANVVKGVARGCWILSPQWVTDSVHNKSWLKEEPYEFVELSPSVRESRIERQRFTYKYSMNLFYECASMYVDKTLRHYKDVKELILICRGKVERQLVNAKYVIGPKWFKGKICISPRWVLDSIMARRKLDVFQYLVGK